MATYPIRQLADNGGTAQFVPVTAPEAVQFPDGSNLNTFIGSVATIESNPVAANHAVGEFLCINGQVYEVIDAMTAGDAIALSENVQIANLGAQITALNSSLMTPKSVTIGFSTVPANDILTADYDISSDPATFGLIVGFMIQSTGDLVPLRVKMNSKTSISVRVRNLTATPQSGASIAVYYI